MYRIDPGQPEEHRSPADGLAVPFGDGEGPFTHPAAGGDDGLGPVGPAERPGLEHLPASAEEVLDALDDMSRRIDHLARELRCLGWFDDDDDDRPRAA